MLNKNKRFCRYNELEFSILDYNLQETGSNWLDKTWVPRPFDEVLWEGLGSCIAAPQVVLMPNFFFFPFY